MRLIDAEILERAFSTIVDAIAYDISRRFCSDIEPHKDLEAWESALKMVKDAPSFYVDADKWRNP